MTYLLHSFLGLLLFTTVLSSGCERCGGGSKSLLDPKPEEQTDDGFPPDLEELSKGMLLGDLDEADVESASDSSGVASIDSTERSIESLEAGMKELREETAKFETRKYLSDGEPDGHSDS